MRRLFYGLPLLAAITTTPLFAAGFEPGLYVAVNAGRASVSSDYVDDSNDITLGAATGYQFNRNFVVEIYTRSLSFNPVKRVLAGYYPERHTGIALMASAPLDDKISGYARLGIGSTAMTATRASLEVAETDPAIGIGGSYAFVRNWSLDIEATRLTKSEVNLLTVGLRYKF